MEELVRTSGNAPAAVVIASKLAGSLLLTTIYGFLIILLCIFLFAVLITVLTRSGHRWAVLRRMFIPLIAFVLFMVLLVLLTGAEDLLNPIVNGFVASTSDSQQLGSLVIAAVELLVLIILTLILLVWEFKAIYLAAVDVFRADDAHPLLAPFTTTVVSWAFAGIAWFTGGPTGVPDWLRWLLILGGPTGISAINILACWRLWQKYHDVLFRNGPRGPGQRMSQTAASPWEVPIVSAGIAVLGPLTAILAMGGVYLSPTSGPVSLDWSYTTANSVASSPAVAGNTVYIGSDDDNVYALTSTG